MKIDRFSEKYDLASKTELEKVAYLAYLNFAMTGEPIFSLSDVTIWFRTLHFGEPNLSRLQRKLLTSPNFTKAGQPRSFRLHAKCIKTISGEMPDLKTIPTEPESDGSILPDSLLEGKRSYIQRFGKQINASFANGIFDGCAVLMRRMVEICLIHSYENNSIESQIKNGPDYKDLKEIIKDATGNPHLNLTKDSKSCLDEFRLLGNLSAHQLFYNCKPEEITRVKLKFRLLIEELFNKAGKKIEK